MEQDIDMDGYDELLEEIFALEKMRKIYFEEAMKLPDFSDTIQGEKYEYFNDLDGARRFRDLMHTAGDYTNQVGSKALELHTTYDIPAMIFVRHNDYYYKLEHTDSPDHLAFYAKRVQRSE